MNLHGISIISFGYWDEAFLREMAKAVAAELNRDVQVREGHLDVSDYYDANRRQYNANELLQHIETTYGAAGAKSIGLFTIDLYIPIFTYIFGQAFLNGGSGIVSVFRLNNERYGMPADELLMMERTAKEIIHELGHTLGLIHCHDTDCVMRGGSYVEDIDQKSRNFCPECRSKLME